MKGISTMGPAPLPMALIAVANWDLFVVLLIKTNDKHRNEAINKMIELKWK